MDSELAAYLLDEYKLILPIATKIPNIILKNCLSTLIYFSQYNPSLIARLHLELFFEQLLHLASSYDISEDIIWLLFYATEKKGSRILVTSIPQTIPFLLNMLQSNDDVTLSHIIRCIDRVITQDNASAFVSNGMLARIIELINSEPSFKLREEITLFISDVFYFLPQNEAISLFSEPIFLFLIDSLQDASSNSVIFCILDALVEVARAFMKAGKNEAAERITNCQEIIDIVQENELINEYDCEADKYHYIECTNWFQHTQYTVSSVSMRNF